MPKNEKNVIIYQQSSVYKAQKNLILPMPFQIPPMEVSMLADVMIQKEKEREKNLLEEYQKNHFPINCNVLIYSQDIHIIGGIETWLYTIAKTYNDCDIVIMYDTADEEQIRRLEQYVKVVKNVNQPIKCNTIMYSTTMAMESKYDVEARKILTIHADYKFQDYIPEVPDDVEIYAVSKIARDSFAELTGKEVKILYNPLSVDKPQKVLKIVVASRGSSEKGFDNVKIAIRKLQDRGRPFLMLIFTDLPFECDDKRVIFMDPTLDIITWMYWADWIFNPSYTEAFSYTINESLCIGKPVIVCDIPMLKEAGITKDIAMICKTDMSNLNIDDLYNKIPKVDNYIPPNSEKEWNDIMKKKVLREKRQKQPKKNKKKNNIVEQPIEQNKKKRKNKEIEQNGKENFEKDNKKGFIFFEKAFSKQEKSDK